MKWSWKVKISSLFQALEYKKISRRIIGTDNTSIVPRKTPTYIQEPILDTVQDTCFFVLTWSIKTYKTVKADVCQ